MKIKPDHLACMQAAIQAVAHRLPAHRLAVIQSGKFKDLEKRIRWDALYMAGLTKWICDNVYSYANDEHIDTALKAIVKAV